VARGVGRSKWTLGALVNYGIDGMISFHHKPLRLSIYLGLLVTFFAFLYLGLVVINTLVDGVDVPGYATLMAGVVGLGGVHMLFLGVIGEYLGKIYLEVKRRPHFLVKDSSVPTAASVVDVREPAGGPVLRYIAADP